MVEIKSDEKPKNINVVIDQPGHFQNTIGVDGFNPVVGGKTGAGAQRVWARAGAMKFSTQ